MDPYQELGVKRDATPEEVKRAYRKKAHKAHPDKGGTKEKFHAVQKSYEILADPDRRKRFDQTGDADAPTMDPREAAMRDIAAMFLQLVNSCSDVEHTNIVELVKQNIEIGVRERKGKIVQLKTGIEKRERALKRVKRKTAGPNHFGVFLQNDIAAHHQAIAKLEGECEQASIMLEMLAEYEYTADIQRATPAMMFSFASNPNSFTPFGR